MLTKFIIQQTTPLLFLILLCQLISTSNVEIVVKKNGITKTNLCNVDLMSRFIPDIDPRDKRKASNADEEFLQICPNNKYTCCSIEDMEPMLGTFKYTRELLLFKNKMLEKLLLYFNSVAPESFDKFLSSFTEKAKKCTGEREFENLKMYYDFVQKNSEEVLEMVKQSTQQIINLYSSFLCTICSPVNNIIFEYDEKEDRPVLHINKRTCSNILNYSMERKNLRFMWNRINKILNAVFCKEDKTIAERDDIFLTYKSIEKQYKNYDECSADDKNFVDRPECARICKNELKLFTLDDFRLRRVIKAIEEFQKNFEIDIKQKKNNITELLMQEETEKHPEEDIKNYIMKLNKITDRYFFLKPIESREDSRYDISKIDVRIEKYSGLVSNSYEINMLYFDSQGIVSVMMVFIFMIIGFRS